MKITKATKKKLDESKDILIIISRPIDNDCIASGIVLFRHLKRRGKIVSIFSPIKIPSYLNSLPLIEIIENRDPRKEDLAEFDLIITVDGGNTRQFSKVGKDSDFDFDDNKEVLNIDHHLGNTHFSKYRIWDKNASSTVEVLLSTIVDIEEVGKDEATLLYGGLVGDTGNFRYNFSEKTLKLAAELLAKGADYQVIINEYCYGNTDIEFQVFAFLIQNTIYNNKFGYTYVIADYNKLSEEYKCSFDEVKGGIRLYENYFSRAVKKINISFVFKKNNNDLNVSMRGNGYHNKIPLPEIGKSLGCECGGHFNASGFNIKGDIDNILEDIKRVVGDLRKKYSSTKTN